MNFKIRTNQSGKITATYLGEEKKFQFLTQTSMPNVEFTLYKGTQIDMEFDAVGFNPAPGEVVDCEGVFYNFTKKNPPKLVFCVTKVLICA